VLKETEFLLAGYQNGAVKRKKSKKERDQTALAAVAKEMEQPRFAESAREGQEAARHQVTKHKKQLG
jgi:hypothetical protein